MHPTLTPLPAAQWCDGGMDALYTAIAHASGGGRDGHVRTEDDRLDLDTRAPQELGGSGEGTNPEQLFAAGYSACFLSALTSVARVHRVRLRDARVRAEVTIAGGPDGFDLAVELVISAPGVSPDEGQVLLEAAHRKCPYSKAVTGNIPVTLTLAPEGSS